MSAIETLVDLLAGRRDAARLTPREWDGVVCVARAESLLGTLADRLADADVPAPVVALFADQRAAAVVATAQALWEADMARRALAPLGIDFVLLKGAAYAAADLPCSPGRQIGDLDILVAHTDLDAAEAALLAAGWEWVKADAYDDAYYRDHMHELPPLIHKSRDRMIDVHHTILPRTHRATPDAAALLADAVTLPSGLKILAPLDRLCHCAAHLIADGDLQGGLRNLWDFHCLIGAAENCEPDLWPRLAARAVHHGLLAPVRRAARLANEIYDTALPPDWAGPSYSDAWFSRRLLARDDWGVATRPMLQQLVYIRSHWLRMPPPMLARHLFAKWRKGRGKG